MTNPNGNTELAALERMILGLAESEAHLKDQFARLAEVHPVRCAAQCEGSYSPKLGALHIHRCNNPASFPDEVKGLLVHRCISTECGGYEWTEPTPHLRAVSEPVKPKVSDERVQEILDILNGFVVREYEGGTEIVDGKAMPVRTLVGCDTNLDHAVDWAIGQRDVAATFGPQDGQATIELIDGTELEFESDKKQWAVTISDDAEAAS